MNKTKKIISKIISILLVVFIAVPLIPFQAKAASYDTNVTFSGGHGSYTDLNGEGLAFFSGEDVKKIVVMYNNATVPNDTYDVEYSYYIHSNNTQGDLGETAPTGNGYYSVTAEVKDRSTGGTVAVNCRFFHIMDKPTYTIYFKDDTKSLGNVSITWGDAVSSKTIPQPENKAGYRFVGWYEVGEDESLVDLSKPFEPVPIGDLGTAHAKEYYAKWDKLTKVDEEAPTCTEDGTAEYWTDDKGNIFADAYGLEKLDMPGVIEATGHKWDEPVYSWSVDETEVTASRKCQNDASHVETETVKTEIVIVKEPTDTEDGILQVIATFKNSAFEKQVREYGFNRGGEDEYALISELTEWIKGGKDPLSMRFKNLTDDEGTFDQFLGIKVDDELVDEDNYTKEKGSVIVNLKPEYLEKLSVGEHTIEAMFIYGSAKAKFTIKEAKATEAKATEVKVAEAKKEAAKSNATKTGDSSPLLIAIIVMAVSALAIVTMIVVKKKKKN